MCTCRLLVCGKCNIKYIYVIPKARLSYYWWSSRICCCAPGVVAWDQAPHWGKKEKKIGVGEKKKNGERSEPSREVVWGGAKVAEGKKSFWDQRRGKTSTHAPGWAFPVTFSVTLSSPIKVSHARSASFCVQLVVQLLCFMLLQFLTIS